MEEYKEEIEVQLFSSLNGFEINQICVILNENNIPYIIKNEGSGSYLNISMGQSIQEQKVFVNKKDLDKSLELISMFISENINNEIINETEEQVEDDERGNKYKTMKRSLGIAILGFSVIAMIIVIIFGLIN